MKVAILSDIHGNYQALESVLKDIKDNGCEKIFCLGDLAMAGPEPEKVIDFVRSQNDWEIIQGNTDKLIAEFTPKLLEDTKDAFPVMGNALENDVTVIKEENKQFLKNLPPQKKLAVEGVKVLLVHGSPRRNNENIFPEMPVSEIEEMLKDTDADLIFCGHTHLPAGYQTTTKQTVVNVGSIGRPMTEDAKPCYVIADFKDGSFSIEHRFVDYDRNTTAKIMENRKFEGSEKIAKMLLHPTTRHI